MSVLPNGRPLRQVLPDLDELMADPHAYLSEAPLAIGPRRFYRLAGLFALPGAVILLSCLLQGKADGERLALGVGLLTGSALWLGWSLWLRGHELVLHPDGVEVGYRGSTVWAPWALFRVRGRPFVPESDSPRAGLLVPLNRAAIPFVELRQHGLILTSGIDVAGPQWRFTGLGEVCLPARYEVDARDVGELLTWLGGRLGQNLPRGAAGGLGEKALRLVEDDADPAGWFVVPLTRFRLPTCCCGCGGPRDTVLHANLSPLADRALGVLTGTARSLEVSVPLCEVCREAVLRRQRIGGGIGLILGTIVGTALGGLVGAYLGEGRQLALYLAALVGLSLGALVGSGLAVALSRRLPVRFRRYNPVRGTVSVRFANPLIAAGVISSLREQAEAAANLADDDEQASF